MERIMSAGSFLPGGHYALATSAGGLLFVSGLLPVVPGEDHPLAKAPFASQFDQVLCQLDAILDEAKIGRDKVAKLTVYLTDIALWPSCNERLQAYFGESRPARCIVPVPSLHYGYLVELEAIGELLP